MSLKANDVPKCEATRCDVHDDQFVHRVRGLQFRRGLAGISRAAFLNTGQVCLGTERIYVERPVFDRFLAALSEEPQSLKPGHPSDKATGIGPLISLKHRDKVMSYYRRAIEDGATLVRNYMAELHAFIVRACTVVPCGCQSHQA